MDNDNKQPQEMDLGDLPHYVASTIEVLLASASQPNAEPHVDRAVTLLFKERRRLQRRTEAAAAKQNIADKSPLGHIKSKRVEDVPTTAETRLRRKAARKSLMEAQEDATAAMEEVAEEVAQHDLFSEVGGENDSV